MSSQDEVISTRVPTKMVREMKEVVQSGNFLNEADFVRCAIRDELVKYKINKIREEFLKNKDSVVAVRKLRKLTSELSDKEYEVWIRSLVKEMP